MSVQINESTKSVSEEAAAGAAVYSNFLLSIYDIEVLMFELQYIFKCPLHKVMDFFNENVSGIHLDVGVGTGYFLDKCNFPVENPTIHLMDLNSNTLRKTSKRIKRYEPVTHQCNILEPIQEDLPMFDSISVINFLHCLPGRMLSKEAAIKNLKPFLRDSGVFFGITVLGQGVDAGILYRKANSLYNKKSIFSNLQDNASDLEVILSNNFDKSSVHIVGSVAFFSGQN
jgi:ubiquinone/menaquinone biosynthesis C-methylase UbiE